MYITSANWNNGDVWRNSEDSETSVPAGARGDETKKGGMEASHK